MTKTIEVTQTIVVTVDESKFTPEFMANFNRHFFDCETIEDHIAFIAKSYAMGVVTHNGDFLEGYGVLRDFGINVKRDTAETEATELEIV